MDPITQFVDQIATQAGLDVLPAEVAQVQKDMITQQLLQRIGLVTMSSLKDDAAKKYMDMLASGNPDPMQLQNFLQTNIPNYSDLLKKTVTDFANEYAAALKK